MSTFMDLQNLIQDKASCKTTFMGETLHFKYRPALITAETFKQLEDMEDIESISGFFCDLIVSWDLTKNEKPLEVTKETFAILPMQLLKAIVQAIVNDVPQSDSGKG